MSDSIYPIAPSLQFSFVFASGFPVLFRGEFLFELLDYLRSNLCALHQLATSLQDGFAEIGDPQILPQDEHCCRILG